MIEQIDGDVEFEQIRLFRAGQALEEDLDRGPQFEAAELSLDVGQDANLSRRPGLAAQTVEKPQQAGDVVHGVDGGVEADQGIAAAERQAPVDEQRDAARIVGGMIGLNARRQRAGQARA